MLPARQVRIAQPLQDVLARLEPHRQVAVVRWLTGADPVEVFATGSALAEPRSEGMAEAGRHPAGAVSRYYSGKVVDDGLHPGWFERVQPTYAAALGHFVASLQSGTAADGGSAVTPSLEDGLKAQAIAEAATLSLRTGRSEIIQY
jgi:myo-inositol 2-dehydrogenase / D-chiro-inositol 1-dehydrogenase